MRTAALLLSVAPLVVEAFTHPSILQRHSASPSLASLRGKGGAITGLPLEAGVRTAGGVEGLRMAGTEATKGMSRKEKQRLKKAEKQAAREAKRSFKDAADGLVDDLMDEVESKTRNLDEINRCISELGTLQSTQPEGAVLKALPGDWKLAYTDSAGTLNEFGTGLGSLPGTSVKEVFLSFNDKGQVEVNEVCRVLGPFPNLRNKLEGSWKLQDRKAGFSADGVAEEGLVLRYEQMTDGRDKVTTGKTGFRVRDVVTECVFANTELLVVSLGGEGQLVFEREEEMAKELTKLLGQKVGADGNVEGEQPPSTLIENIAQVATGAKSPWDAIFKK